MSFEHYRNSGKASEVDTEVDPPVNKQAYSSSSRRGRLCPALMSERFRRSLNIVIDSPPRWPTWLRHASWLLPLVWMGLVFYSLTTQVDIDHDAPWVFPHFDKVVHFGIFAVLAWLWVPPLRGSAQWSRGVSLILAFLLSGAYGGFLEYLQSTLPHRHGNWADVIANLIGAATVWLLAGQPRKTPYQ